MGFQHGIGFLKFKFLTARMVKGPILCHPAKICADRSDAREVSIKLCKPHGEHGARICNGLRPH